MGKANCQIFPTAPNGKDSNLFKDVLESTGSREAATYAYGYARSEEFRYKMGDWLYKNPHNPYKGTLDQNGEPIMADLTEVLITKDFEMPQTQDDRFKPLHKVRELEKRDLYKQLGEFKRKLKETEKDVDRVKYRQLIQRTEQRIDALDMEMEDMLKKSSLEEIEQYARQDLDRAWDILQKDEITPGEMYLVGHIISLWQKAGDFSEDDHLFFDQAELEARREGLKEITDKFLEWKDEADHMYTNYLLPLQRNMVESSVKETFGENASSGLDNSRKDKSWAVLNFLDITETSDTLLQAMGAWVKTAQFKAHQESEAVMAEIDQLIKESGVKDFDLFMQTFSNEDSRLTGNLVFRWTQAYFDESKRQKARLHKARNQAMLIEDPKERGRKIAKIHQNYFRQMAKRSITFDLRKLFPDADMYNETSFTEEERRNHEAELRLHLGDKGYERFIEDAEELLEDYKKDREAYMLELEAEFQDEMSAGDTSNFDVHLRVWEMSNSPYWHAQFQEEGYPSKGIQGMYAKPTSRYVKTVPRRFDTDGNDTGYYDKKYEQIEADEKKLKLYDYIFDTLKQSREYLPNHKISFMQVNTLPMIEKTVLETFARDGMLSGAAGMWESLKKATRSDALSDTEYNDIDPLTGEAGMTHQLAFVSNPTKRVEEYVERKEIEWTGKNGKPESDAELNELLLLKEEWRREATDKLANQKSHDLGMVTKAFAAMALSFKHKALIEPQMTLSYKLMNNSLEQVTNDAGSQMVDKDGNPMKKKGLENMRKMLKDFMETSYYGYPVRIKQGQTKKRVLTPQEKKVRKEIESSMEQLKAMHEKGDLTDAEYNGKQQKLQDQLDKLGGVFTASQFGDMMLKYVQILGLGWNVKAAIANLGFGFISNIIEAADGRSFTIGEYFKAMSLVKSSVLKNMSFNQIETKNAKKIRNMMDKLDVLKDSRYELYKATVGGNKLKEKLNWLDPYNPNARTEYINQASIMVAMLMHDGLWDKYDENGNLKEGEEVDEKAFIDTKLRIDKLNKISHGNYDPDLTLSVKRKFLGRAFSQFRTWAFMGFANRFQAGFYDNQLGYERKGRYRSYSALAQQIGKVMKQESGYRAAAFGAKELLRAATFGVYNPESGMVEGLSEVDQANLRKNLMELYLYLALAILVRAFSAMADTDDDKEATWKYSTFFTINILARLQTDILFYTNPSEFERLQRNALAVFSLVVDSQKALDSTYNWMVGGDDILQRGPNKGESRMLRDWSKLIPMWNQKYRMEAAYSMIFDR